MEHITRAFDTPNVYRPEQWHQRAEELRSVAVKGTRNPDARSLLLQIADEYDLLAARAEDRLGFNKKP